MNILSHSIIYREAGRFGGWPANYGMWAWGDELVVGFTRCTHLYVPGMHARDKAQPAVPWQARSLDGGLSWTAGPTPAPSPGGRGFSADEHMLAELSAAAAIRQGLGPLPAPVSAPGLDFSRPDFALMCARTGLGAGTQAWFYSTHDRAHSWQGPHALPTFDLPGNEARTCYLIDGPQQALFFFTASRKTGEEGAGVFLARTADGGQTFSFAAWVAGSAEHYTIMPAALRTGPTRLLCATRCRSIDPARRDDPAWIDLHESTDNGATWHFLNRPAPDCGPGGSPPAMLLLQDGRIALVYGYRAEPFGIRARLSADGGRSWGEVLTLRAGGGCPDLGYPRTIQRPDGALVTAYYFNDHPQGERYIAATIWKI